MAAYLLWGILASPHSAQILDNYIVYVTEQKFSVIVGLAYFGAVSMPLLLSTQRTIVALGAIILVGCLTAYAFYWAAFVSVWCFFAAAGSAVILFHFGRIRRLRLLAVGT